MARHKDENLHQERRLQILNAAAGIFRTKGFHAARTEEICTAAGLSAGTVFRYFRDKEEIIATIAEMEFNSCQDISKHMFTREGFAHLASIDGKKLKEMWQPAGLGLGLDSWLELFRSDKYGVATREKDEQSRAELAQALKDGQRDGWVREDLDPQSAARIIMTLFSGIMLDSQFNPDSDFEELAAGLRGLVGRYVLKGD